MKNEIHTEIHNAKEYTLFIDISFPSLHLQNVILFYFFSSKSKAMDCDWLVGSVFFGFVFKLS